MLRGLLVPGRCAEICHHHGLVGTSTAGADNRTSGLPHMCPYAARAILLLADLKPR